jgi:hypothetical protein
MHHKTNQTTQRHTQRSNRIKPRNHTKIRGSQESKSTKLHGNSSAAKYWGKKNPRIPELSWFFFAIALTTKEEEQALRLLKTLISKTPQSSTLQEELALLPRQEEMGFIGNEFLSKRGVWVEFLTYTAHRSIPPPQRFSRKIDSNFLGLSLCVTLETMGKTKKNRKEERWENQ